MSRDTRMTTSSTNLLSHEIYSEGWSIWTDDCKLACPSRTNIYAAIYDPITIQKWIRLGRFPEDATDSIDWKHAAESMKSLPLHSRRWITKHASDECGIGVTLEKWKYQDDSICPRGCGHQHEDGDHILQCHAAGADDQWNENTTTLASTLDELDTHPAIQEVLLSSIHNWRHSLEMNIPIPPEVHQAFHEQQQIGWRNLLEGLPSKQWALLQQRYYNSIGSRRTGRSWIRKVLHKLHKLARDQWLHRNSIKHDVLQPRQLAMRRDLNAAICAEYLKGAEDLPPGDVIRFANPLASILLKQLDYRKAWLANVVAARNRQYKKRLHNDRVTTISKEQSILFQWMKTGIAT